MINLREYYTNNSIRYSRLDYVPKRYIAAFAMLHKGEKISAIWQLFSDLFHSNATHKKAFNAFMEESFVLSSKKKIISIKNPEYAGVMLSSDYPFSESLKNGIMLIEKILKVESFYDADEETMKKMLGVEYRDVLDQPTILNCGIDQNVFDFVIARECILNQKTKKYSEIAKTFFNLLIYSELLTKLVDAVKPEQKNKCLQAIKMLSLSNYNPRFELNSIDELKAYDINKLFYYFGFNLTVLINLINYYSDDEKNVIPILFNRFIEGIDSEELDILTRRETETLESIGETYGLTRERVRQIEGYGIEHFNDFFLNNLTSGDKNMIFIIPDITYVLPLSIFKDELGKYYDCFRNVMKYTKFVGEAKYIKEIDAVVETNEVYDFFKEIVFELFGDYFKKSDLKSKMIEALESLSDYGFNEETVMTFINNAYKEKNSLFVKNGIRFTKVYQVDILLKNNFDNGFHFSDINHINELNELAIEEFGEAIFGPADFVGNFRTIQAIVYRADVRQIDSGTFIHTSKAIDLPIDLMDKIITYMNLKNRPLAYSNILETFKEELEEIGITNRYSLQGAMSKYKGELFKSDKDYISAIDIKQTLRDSIVSWIDSTSGFFTYDDFKKEFKGVAMSVLMSAMYNYKNVAYYWEKGYITLKSLNISEAQKEKIKQYISVVISQYQLGYCSADEIFNFVKTNDPNFIESTKMNYSYDLFSVLEAMFSSEYTFKRPLIGMINCEFKSGAETLSKYLSSKTIVKLSSLRKFLDNKIVDRYYTIRDILDEKYNEFVAVDQDTMVRKENLNINEKELVRLDAIIEMLLEQNDKISIQDDIVSKYYFTELAKMKVNRYLIYGVVNTFFHDKYSLTMDTAIFRNGQFSIEKR